MKKNCVICREKFNALNCAITFSEKCSYKRKKIYNKEYQREHLEYYANKTREYAHKNGDKINKKNMRNYYKNRDKALVRVNTYNSNEKTGVCNDCKGKMKTEFHHLSYKPNKFIEVCKRCHDKRHGRNYYGR